MNDVASEVDVIKNFLCTVRKSAECSVWYVWPTAFIDDESANNNLFLNLFQQQGFDGSSHHPDGV